MKNKILNIFIFVVVVFVILQVPISTIASKGSLKPFLNISWDRLINGTYGLELEQSFKENSYISKVSGEKYRSFVYGLFSRTNKNVIVGKNNFLFLRDKTMEIDKNSESEIPNALAYVKKIQKTLKDNGVNLYIVTIPARSRIYPELAYSSKKFPKNRKAFFKKLYSTLSENGVEVLNLESMMVKAKKEIAPIKVFFSVDHHWSYKAVEYISPGIAKELANTFPINKLNPKIIYTNKWVIKTNPHDKIARKLGFPKASLPNKFKQEQNIPVFKPNRDSQNKNAENKLLIASSSYARYGLVEFLSNQFGYPIPFYIERGRGPNYAMANVLQRNLTLRKKYGKPNTVLWLLGESELRYIHSPYEMNIVPEVDDLEAVKFSIVKVTNAKKVGLSVTHKEKDLTIQLKMKESRKTFVLALKVLSNGRPSTVTIANKRFEIIQDGEINYFPIELNKASKFVDVSIYTPPKANKHRDRTFEIIEIYKRN